MSELRYLKRAQWDRLSSSVFNLRDLIILNIFYETGCSVSDIIKVKISDVTPTHIVFNKRKSIISPVLYAKIQTYLEFEGSDKEFLLSSRQSKSITQKRIIQIIKSYSKRAGFEITPQILRYTHIAHAYERNIPINTIISQVGIKKSRAIEIFSELTIRDQEEAYKNFYDDYTKSSDRNVK